MKLTCDNCEKPFEVDDAKAGGKVPCPDCGDINRVPDAAPAAPAAAPAAAADMPPPSATESNICVVRPAMFRAHPFRYLVILALFLGGVVVAIMSRTSDSVPAWLLWPGVILSLFGVAWWLQWWLATTLWIKLVVSNKRTVRHEGIVRRHTTEVLHDHVRSVDISQGFVQRILGVGTIGIDSAGQDGIEIEIKDIPRPYDVKRIVDRYRKM